MSRPSERCDEVAAEGGRGGGTLTAPRTAGWLAGMFLLCFTYFMPRVYDWNSQARLDMTLAIVNRGTIAINDYRWNSQDEAMYGGRYYSNKAPGQSLIGVPFYAAHKGVLRLLGSRSFTDEIGLRDSTPELWAYYQLVEYLETIYTVAIPAMLLLLLFFWFLGYYSSSLLNRAVLTLALGLGTTIFPYAQVFYSHVPAAALLFAAYVLISLPRRGARGPRSAWLVAHPEVTALLAGVALGFALLFEYTAAIVDLILVVYALARLPRRLLPYLAIGGVPGLTTLLTYDLIAYHDPFGTGYGHNAVPYWRRGIPGILESFRSPRLRPRAILDLAVSPSRGLFFLSPWLLLALPGFALWARRRTREWVLPASIATAFFLLVSTFSGWEGGSAVGPRYLTPMLPFLALPVIFVLEWASTRPAVRAGSAVLLLVSGCAVWVETLGGTAGSYPGQEIHNPLFSYSLPMLLHGFLPQTLGSVFLGPYLGSGAVVVMLPLAVLLGAWSAAALAPAIAAGRRAPVTGRSDSESALSEP